MKKALLVTCLFITFFASAEVRKYSNAYLHIGVGARGLAMGNSICASTSDVYGLYYNPAGITHIKREVQLSAMHSEYFGGIAKYDYGALAFDLRPGKNALSIGFIRYAVDDIPNTLNLFNPDGSIDYNNITSFSVGDYGFFISYSHLIKFKNESRLSIGASPKLIYRRAGTFANAVGFGMDIGAQYRLKKGWQFGLMLRDATSTFNAWSFHFTDAEKQILAQTGNAIPISSLETTAPEIVLAAAYQWKIKDRLWILPEADITFNTDGRRNVLIQTSPVSMDLNAGFEIGYKDIVQLRTGISNIQRSTDSDNKQQTSFQPNIGIGVGFKFIHLDYAFTNLGNQSEGLYAHVVSLKISLPKKAQGE